jgi:hypothetical protein
MTVLKLLCTYAESPKYLDRMIDKKASLTELVPRAGAEAQQRARLRIIQNLRLHGYFDFWPDPSTLIRGAESHVRDAKDCWHTSTNW